MERPNVRVHTGRKNQSVVGDVRIGDGRERDGRAAVSAGGSWGERVCHPPNDVVVKLQTGDVLERDDPAGVGREENIVSDLQVVERLAAERVGDERTTL